MRGSFRISPLQRINSSVLYKCIAAFYCWLRLAFQTYFLSKNRLATILHELVACRGVVR